MYTRAMQRQALLTENEHTLAELGETQEQVDIARFEAVYKAIRDDFDKLPIDEYRILLNMRMH